MGNNFNQCSKNCLRAQSPVPYKLAQQRHISARKRAEHTTVSSLLKSKQSRAEPYSKQSPSTPYPLTWRTATPLLRTLKDPDFLLME